MQYIIWYILKALLGFSIHFSMYSSYWVYLKDLSSSSEIVYSACSGLFLKLSKVLCSPFNTFFLFSEVVSTFLSKISLSFYTLYYVSHLFLIIFNFLLDLKLYIVPYYLKFLFHEDFFRINILDSLSAYQRFYLSLDSLLKSHCGPLDL